MAMSEACGDLTPRPPAKACSPAHVKQIGCDIAPYWQTSVSMTLGNGDGTFSSTITPNIDVGPAVSHVLEVVDVNNDGVLDGVISLNWHLTAAGALQDTLSETSTVVDDTDIVRLLVSSVNTTAVTITLGTNLEGLDGIQTGCSRLNLTANALRNALTGKDAATMLSGGAGADTLDGGNGSDLCVHAALADFAAG